MFIRFALYLLYIIVPFAIALIAYFSVTLSDRNQTSIYYILSTSKLINPEIIFYRNPNDVLFKSTTYLSDDILNLLESQGYLEKSDIKYDFSEFKECNKYKIENITIDIEIFALLLNFSFIKKYPKKTLKIGIIKYPKLASIIRSVATA